MTENSDLVEKELLEILEEAIQEERTSAARYRRGSKMATDPEVKNMFDRLAADEIGHEKALKERYYEIKKRLGLKVMGGDEKREE